MKFKDLFPVLCLALLLISEFFLFSANRQKSAALAQMRQAQQRVAELEAELAATNSGAANETAQTIRMRAENQDLPRLRTQVQQLQADNSKLLQLLTAAQQTAGRREAQLEEIEAQNEQAAEDQQAQDQLVARTETQERNTCIANLRLIYAAKQAWALDKNKTDSDVPTEQDLLPYLKAGVFPVCPAGGVYTIGAVGQLPTCSIPGHVLPPQ